MCGTSIRSASSGASFVFVDQPAEAVAADDLADGRDRLTTGQGRAWLQPPVRPRRVVVPDVLAQDPLEVAQPDGERPVQALAPDRSQPALGVGPGAGRPERGADDPVRRSTADRASVSHSLDIKCNWRRRVLVRIPRTTKSNSARITSLRYTVLLPVSRSRAGFAD